MSTHRLPLKFQTLLLVAGLAVLLSFAYQNSFSGSFHSDDYIVIQSNPNIGQPSQFWNFPPRYRQWLSTSFSLNFEYGGLNPWGYHAVNFALHIGTTLLLIALIRLTLSSGCGWEAFRAMRVALFAGTLFALHPVHTETITYISGRSSGLSAFFYLGALLAFACSQLAQTSRVARAVALPLILLAGAGALLSKETSITLPLGLLAYDICFMRGNRWLPRSSRWLWVYGPTIGLALLLLFTSPTLKSQAILWLGKIEWNLWTDQLPVLAHGLKLLIWPINLTFDYDFPRTSFLQGSVWTASALIWTALLFLAWQRRDQQPSVFPFAVIWFVIIFLPTNSVLPRLDLLSERNLYLPSIGWCWWAGMMVERFFQKQASIRLQWTLFLCGAIVIGCFITLTVLRNEVYRNDVTLWQDTLEKSPEKSEVHYYLGMAHYLAGDPGSARRELQRLKQKDPLLIQNALATQEASGQRLESYFQLLGNLRRVTQSDPERFQSYGRIYQELAGLFDGKTPLYYTRLLLGAGHAEKGNMKLAEVEFRKAQEAKPHLPHAYLDLAALYAQSGYTDRALTQLDEARTRLHLAPKLRPDWAWKRGQLLFNSGQVEDAIAQLNEVTGPRNAEAQFQIGLAHIQQKKFQYAMKAFEATLAQNPEHLPARFNLAKLILDQAGDKDIARKHLNFLLQRTKDPNRRQMVQTLLAKTDNP